MDRWTSIPVKCSGGLILNSDALTQGTSQPGSARTLQNFECALEGGYRRISGYSKFDTNTVPGLANSPILGVKAAFGGVLASRFNSTGSSNNIYFSTGSGWGSRINSANRTGAVTRQRMIGYSITKPVVVGCDGINPAWKWDGTTYTLLNGTGAPADPKYAEMFLARLVLSGYSANVSSITISAPNDDTDYAAGDGALEINVGDVVVGIKNFRNNLYIFGQNRVFKLTGSSATDFAIQPVTGQIGCLNGDTIQEVAGDLIYLAPDGFRSVAGTYNIGDVDLSLQSRAIQPIIRTLITDTGNTQFPSMVVRKKSQYRCWFYDSTVPRQSAIGVIGKVEQGSPLEAFNYIYTTYAWSTSIGIQPYSADSFFDANVERCIIGDPTNGFVYSLESGNDFDGTAIQAVYASPYITFQDASVRKVLQKADIYTQLEGSATINLGILFDFQNASIAQPPNQQLTGTGNFPVYGGALYGTDVYSSVQFPIFKQDLVGSGFTASFNYTSNGGAPYRIDSYQITYAPKGRR